MTRGAAEASGQRDTLDSPLDSKNANRCAYAADDPIDDSDPLGLRCTISRILADVGGAAGIDVVVGGAIGGGIGVFAAGFGVPVRIAVGGVFGGLIAADAVAITDAATGCSD
jgi:hypothetical protein